MLAEVIGKKGSITRLRTTLVLFLIVIFGSAVLIAFYSEKDAIWAEKTRIGTDKRVVALAGAKRLEEFFQRAEADLSIFAHTAVEMDINNKESRELIGKIVKRYEGAPLADMVLVNKEGKSVLLADPTGVREAKGIDLSDREYFVWAQKQDDEKSVFLTMPLIARGGFSEGQKAIAVVKPVFSRGIFNGVVVESINFDRLVSDYAASLVVYGGSKVMLLDEDGELLIGEMSGKNIREITKECCVDSHEEYVALLDELVSGKNSWVELEMFSGKRGEKWIAGFAPVNFGGRQWTIVVMVSQDEVFGRLDKFQQRVRLSIVVIGIGVVAVGLLSILAMRQAQSVWFERGFYSGQMKKFKKALKKTKKKT